MARSGTDTDRLIVVGVLAGAHGVRGDVRVKSFTEDPEACFDYGALLDAEGRELLVPKACRPAKTHFIVTPERVRQKEEWDALKGTKLHVLRAHFEATDEDEFYIEDLVGLAARSPDGTGIGKVKAVQNYGAGDLVEIQPERGGKSVFIPFTEVDIPTVDLAHGLVTIADFEAWADESDGTAQA